MADQVYLDVPDSIELVFTREGKPFFTRFCTLSELDAIIREQEEFAAKLNAKPGYSPRPVEEIIGFQTALALNHETAPELFEDSCIYSALIGRVGDQEMPEATYLEHMHKTLGEPDAELWHHRYEFDLIPEIPIGAASRKSTWRVVIAGSATQYLKRPAAISQTGSA